MKRLLRSVTQLSEMTRRKDNEAHRKRVPGGARDLGYCRHREWQQLHQICSSGIIVRCKGSSSSGGRGRSHIAQEDCNHSRHFHPATQEPSNTPARTEHIARAACRKGYGFRVGARGFTMAPAVFAVLTPGCEGDMRLRGEGLWGGVNQGGGRKEGGCHLSQFLFCGEPSVWHGHLLQ